MKACIMDIDRKLSAITQIRHITKKKNHLSRFGDTSSVKLCQGVIDYYNTDSNSWPHLHFYFDQDHIGQPQK